MKPNITKYHVAATLACLLWVTTIYAAGQPKMKMTTPIAPGVAVPDKVETFIGTLNLNYAYPDDETTRKVYDNLDASRALQALLPVAPCDVSGAFSMACHPLAASELGRSISELNRIRRIV